MTGHLDSATAPDAVPQAYLDDGDVQLYHGDVIQTLRSLPAGIAQTCVTSPPYWGLRDYGTGTEQIGLEETPDLYVERMVAVFREVRRVLADTGTVWCNLGDSFLPGKQLAGIPWRVAFALQTDGWYLRSDIIWNKPNPMPESVVDRPTKAHEYLFLLSKQRRYYMDMDAIREENASPEQAEHNAKYARVYEAHTERVANGQGIQPGNVNNLGIHARGGATAGRNRRSVWTIPTEPFPEAHFATYPQALVRPCILAGTSERGECVECGAPWVREVERTPMVIARSERTHSKGHTRASGTMLEPNRSETTGWRASCKCDAPTRPQTVLDPFIGSGTTALVARNHNRRCIGIDLSSEYLAIAARRLQQLSLLGGTT